MSSLDDSDDSSSSSAADPMALAKELGFGADLIPDSSDEEDLSEEDDSNEDLSDSDNDNSNNSDNVGKVVIKEAPLLRLENVTSMTRSRIPDSPQKKKGGWGWFGSRSRKETTTTAAAVAVPAAPLTTPDPVPVETPVTPVETPSVPEPPLATSNTSAIPADSSLREQPSTVVEPDESSHKEEEEEEEEEEQPKEEEKTSWFPSMHSHQSVPAEIDNDSSKQSFSSFGDSVHSNTNGPKTATATSTLVESPYKKTTATAPLGLQTLSQNTAEVEAKSKQQQPSIQKQQVQSETKPTWKSAVAVNQSSSAADNRSTSQPSRQAPPPGASTVALDTTVSSHSNQPKTITSNPKEPHSSASSQKSSDVTSMYSVESSLARFAAAAAAPSSLTQVQTSRNDEPPTQSPLSKKKKKKKRTQTNLHDKFQHVKVTRHGDEVSVGTTTLRIQQPGAQLQRLIGLMEDIDNATGKKTKPWKKALKDKTTLLPMDRSLAEPILEEDRLEELESLKSSEHFYRDDGGRLEDQHMLGGSESSSQAGDDSSVFTGVSEVSRATQDKEPDDSRSQSAQSEGNELEDVINLARIEAKMELESDEHVDFDGMWETVDCDAPTADEFQRKQRQRSREKQEKKLRKQQRETKKETIQRLRIFEKRKQEIEQRRKKKGSRLSSEFLDSVHQLFRDESTTSNNETEETDFIFGAMGPPKRNGTLLTKIQSDKSLFITDESIAGRSSALKSKVSNEDDDIDSQEDHSEASRQDEDGGSIDDSSHASTTSSHSGITTSTRKPRLDPEEVFEKEMKKVKADKVMTVADLRQEMADRRGTSVLLIRKEYATYKQKQKLIASAGGAVQRLGNANMDDVLQFGGAAVDSASQRDVALRKENENATIGSYMESHERIARWGDDRYLSDLDDLATVQMSPQRIQGRMGAIKDSIEDIAQDIATGNIPHIDLDVRGQVQAAATTIRTHAPRVPGAGSTMNAVSSLSALSPRKAPQRMVGVGSPTKSIRDESSVFSGMKTSPKNENSQRSARSSFRDTTSLLLSAPSNERDDASVGSGFSGMFSPKKASKKSEPKDPNSLLAKFQKEEEAKMPSLQLPSLSEADNHSTDFSFAASFADVQPLTTIKESNDDDAEMGLFGDKPKRNGSRFGFGKKLKFPNMKIPKRGSGGGAKLLGDNDW